MSRETNAYPNRVLLVEDEVDLTDLYVKWIGKEYDVEVAHTGQQAREMVDGSFDVVLLDRRLPDVSGDETLRWIQQQGIDCMVAMVSAVEPDLEIYDMGFDDYVVKPVSEAELMDLIQRMLTRDAYDEQLRKLFAVASKIALLETHKSAIELAESDIYKKLCDERDALDTETVDLIGELSNDDLVSILRKDT